MFTFGILSSHLPYVAFAAFYLFYLFFPSQFKQLNDEPVKNSDEKTICIQISEQPNQVLANQDFQFQTDIEIKEPDDLIAPEYFVSNQIPILQNNKGPGFRYYSPLFSRPPPIV